MKELFRIIIFTVFFSVLSIAEDSYEPNNNFENAKLLDYGTYNLEAVDNADIFKVNIQPGMLYLKMTPDGAKDLNMTLYNSDYTVIQTNYSSGIESFQKHIDTEGTYFIKVEPTHYSNYTTYELEISNNYYEASDDSNDFVSSGNDIITNAVDLGTIPYTLTSQKSYDDDWYKVTVPAGTFTANLNFDVNNGDIKFEIYNSSFVRIADSVNTAASSSGRELIIPNTQESIYYISVFSQTGNSYSLDLQVPNNSDDAYEDNESFDTAHSIIAGSHSLTALDDDWFKIYLNPGLINIEMIPADTIDLNMDLRNSSNQVVKANYASGTETINYHVYESGYYYIKVYPTGVPNTTYTLNINTNIDISGDDSSDDTSNDNINSATVLSTSEVLNQKAYEEDWFKVDVPVGNLKIDLEFTYSSSNDDIKLEVYNSSFIRVNDSVNEIPTSSGRSIEMEVTESQTYYIAVFDENQRGNQYNLKLTNATKWAKLLNYGPIRDASISLYDIDGDGEKEIFVGTSKGLDSNLNEIRPAGLICLEPNGDVKWEKQFPAMSTVDSQTNILYNTTSVSSSPVFGDVNNDGEIDIVVGVGGDINGEAGEYVVGQPGDKGGIYALDKNGNTLWYHQSNDTIGGTQNVGDDRPDGVFGSAVIFDIDKDGKKEVIYGGWDQYVWVLDGETGVVQPNWPVHILDTIWATPLVTDINQDGIFDILMSADITENSDAGTQTGGIFHILDSNANQNISGFDEYIGNSNYTTLKGKYEEQTLWSSPSVSDIDNDGYLEIIYGTGNFFHDTRGSYIKVWNHDGTEKFKLDTQGRTFSSPLVADLDNNGYKEIIATTLDGYLYVWNYNGSVKFAIQTSSFKSTQVEPIFSSPIAIDINNDGNMEILYAQGTQVTIVDKDGNQLNDTTKRDFVFESYKGSVAVDDIDNDGYLDILSGGTNSDKTQAMVYRWQYGDIGNIQNPRSAKNQEQVSSVNVENFVKRFYQEVLNRTADSGGLTYWMDKLITGLLPASEIANGFINSQEFLNRTLDNEAFVNVLYSAFFNRTADSGGLSTWLNELSGGTTRQTVLNGFINSQEFINLANSYGILATKPDRELTVIEQFVKRFYEQCLLREPDDAGLQDWSTQLKESTKTGSDVAFGFVFSQEFINRSLSNEDFLTVLYKAFFNRDPDSGGYNDWLIKLQNNEYTREKVLNGFLGATEFYNLCNDYGITPQ